MCEFATERTRTWKVFGPDANGRFGSLQGTGGLEAVILDASGTTTGVINDQFGNGVATVTGTGGSATVTWNTTRVGAYGPLPGITPQTLGDVTQLAAATAWRGHRIDPTGFYWLGARYYEPTSGRFLSADPLGHGVSPSLYDYADGDPVNRIDPDGRCFDGGGSSRTMILDLPGRHVRTDVSLDWYDRLQAIIPGKDGFDREFEYEIGVQATNVYRWGHLSGSELYEAVNRGYLSYWDLPVDLVDGTGPHGVRPGGSSFYNGLSVRDVSWLVGSGIAAEVAGEYVPLLFRIRSFAGLVAADTEIGAARITANPRTWPKPPGWSEDWEIASTTRTWDEAARTMSGKGARLRWFDESGGEWRLHQADKWHPETHWDYNPNTTWNSAWQNVDTNGNLLLFTSP